MFDAETVDFSSPPSPSPLYGNSLDSRMTLVVLDWSVGIVEMVEGRDTVKDILFTEEDPKDSVPE